MKSGWGMQSSSTSTTVAIAFSIAILMAGLATQLPAFLNHDVAFLSWVAHRVLGGAVYGRDILEVNFPMAFLIYMPAAMVEHFLGLSLAVKLWTFGLEIVSLLLLSRALPMANRGIVLMAFAAFLAFALPREFAQREQIAFILTAPWCVAAPRSKRHSIFVGVLAGIGFSIKPHFLIPLALLALYRRKFGYGERAIVITGALYAIALPTFFWPFLTDSLPLAQAAYWAIGSISNGVAPALVAGVLIITCSIAAIAARDALAKEFLIAAIGFLAAAVLQQKLFPYHLLPVWGFLVLASASLFRERRLVASALLVACTYVLAIVAMPWWRDSDGRAEEIPQLTAFLDRGSSFTVIAVHPYPSFPTALHTRACFLGWSNSHWFLPAVAKIATGQTNRTDPVAEEWAVRQAVTELSRSPDRVVVDTDWRRHTGLLSRRFDAIAWLERNPEFLKLWKNYAKEAKVGEFLIYRRRNFDHTISRHCSPVG